MSANGPRLPPELECKVFELTARMHPATIHSLLLVAHRVHIWIEPFLYRTLRVRMYDQLLRFTQTKPGAASFLASAVRHVTLVSYRPGMAAILQLCTGITHLAVTSDPEYAFELRPLLPVLRISHLAVELAALYPPGLYPSIDATQPTFSSLTHLDFFDGVDDADHERIISFLTSLPALTHLSYNRDLSAQTLVTLLDKCQKLRLLMRLTSFAKAARDFARDLPFKQDVRLVVCMFKEWDDAVLDVRSYWDIAEEFVARKRTGEVPANVFFARNENEKDLEDLQEDDAEETSSHSSSSEAV
ncbi:hypothetical protein C8F01DRAFT_216442 [Mycena amicta]|nr:hypothetical protein C8F01DRAFT_216442 [Mycena amicta]